MHIALTITFIVHYSKHKKDNLIGKQRNKAKQIKESHKNTHTKQKNKDTRPQALNYNNYTALILNFPAASTAYKIISILGFGKKIKLISLISLENCFFYYLTTYCTNVKLTRSLNSFEKYMI